MSRSLSGISQRQWHSAWSYHPFGFAFYPLFVFSASFLLLPPLAKEKVRAWLQKRNGVFAAMYGILLVGFVIFGVSRIVLRLFI